MFDKVSEFESVIANYFGAPYAVATDCCTHAIELCLRYNNIKSTSCPKHTYPSIPMTFMKLGIAWQWDDIKWQDYYRLGQTDIIDAAVLWREKSYLPGTMMCVSFQFKKHLALGRGGIILLDDKRSRDMLSMMAYDGRSRQTPWAEQDIEMMGYHYYMTPEIAERGIDRFIKVRDQQPRSWSYLDYPDISKMTVFQPC